MPRKRSPRVRYCEFCGHPFGIERGPAAKTCSPECERDRNNAKEKARYQRVKDTPEWRATRADYLGRVKERATRDPEFAERLARNHRDALRRFRAALAKDPDRLEAARAAGREWHRQRTPEQRAARKYWYGSLSPELKQLFLLDLRQQRAYERLKEIAMAFKWPEEKSHLLGTMPDVAVAKELGCTSAVVAYQRKLRGIPTYVPPSSWDDANNHLLGTMPDRALSKQVGVPTHIVRHKRIVLKVPAYGRDGYQDWTPEEEAKLGTDTDAIVAQELGRSRASVLQRRVKLNIPPVLVRTGIPNTAKRQVVHVSEEMQAKLDELHEPLLQRYRDAGLPMDELQPWQIVEIALNELLQSVRKSQARKTGSY
jgi:hypothetical protein